MSEIKKPYRINIYTLESIVPCISRRLGKVYPLGNGIGYLHFECVGDIESGRENRWIEYERKSVGLIRHGISKALNFGNRTNIIKVITSISYRA